MNSFTLGFSHILIGMDETEFVGLFPLYFVKFKHEGFM